MLISGDTAGVKDCSYASPCVKPQIELSIASCDRPGEGSPEKYCCW